MLDIALKRGESKRFWDAYNAHEQYRVPISLAISTRCWAYALGVEPLRYFKDPIYMMRMQLLGQKWVWENVPQDQLEPEQWAVWPDFQNFYEAMWWGCPIHWSSRDLGSTFPRALIGEKEDFNWEFPDPLRGNGFAQVHDFWKAMSKEAKSMSFEGKRVTVTAPTGHDGPLTVAFILRGSKILTDLVRDPDYVRKLVEFITEATIVRLKAWMDLVGTKYPFDSWSFADDSIENLSPRLYREIVLPSHKRLVETFSCNVRPNGIHLCGRVRQHLRTIRDELNVGTFDLGFPTELGWARRELGQKTHLIGNINPALLLSGPGEAIEAEVKRILASSVAVGGYNFTLHDGNNVAPGTPLENMWAFYNAGIKYGRMPIDE
jgi:uroporphyrinogen-III decarboxylase